MSTAFPLYKDDSFSLESLSDENLTMRLAVNERDLHAVQALRYRVFYEEMTAEPTEEMRAVKRDFDQVDPFCDHMMVIDHKKGDGPESVVGTYRLLRRDGAAKNGHFYSQEEFNLDKILARPGEVLELGRSCVEAEYRTQSILNRLWGGIAAYVMHYDVKVMFGCASLPGADPEKHKVALSYLYHNHLAGEDIRPFAIEGRCETADMNAVDISEMSPRQIVKELPPLVKGYLRVGGVIGDGAVVDHQFDSVDVCVVVETDKITDKYSKHFMK